ncbi:CDP-diacylglycerol-inositol 3-phosphatidyltransferase 1 [Auxenochlorella protothecoides]|uniref:CDP-diacylglycerol--inositol 3-phosphatidyltransferase n=1 Tax=Auxenochlorella protothecoides TaxID=3075 RepID=A0A087SBF7_AUXPR|nr:CDP-diacylglycerol-inositol 3-phosphatidyltransferase 1 [Auxenochlorella protothecoides]KFM23061.1 CDP-diacylglycerol-inositol 3-phosphatidyltransferase 1 [Auxenochlorella protothecoides]RMZ54789.1 hypothetical protein APUTEX25_000306 [Auxenochlorella protothecoides]|eukprot:RMZ54789.1 hypothetical protein APUTEX25_000306 [Auxenochlorella protothecoides]
MAGSPGPSFFERHDNVYLYVPNLIGYARIAFALYGFAVASTSPGAMVLSYALSFVCDELDGRFARMLNQTSTLGQVLDMVTDRVATSCLLATLCMLFPAWHLAFVVLLGLDIFSHWFQMYSTLACGVSSHKDTNSRSRVVRFYYQQRLFMGFCCVCCEVLYLCLYLLAWPQYRAWGVLPLPQTWLQLGGSAGVCSAEARGIPLVALVALAALPGVAVKQFVNVVQLGNAMTTLVQLDTAKRQ